MKKLLISLLLLSSFVIAWSNTTMNEDYRLIIQGKIIRGIVKTYEIAFGDTANGRFFYFIAGIIPYTFLWLAHDSIKNANIFIILYIGLTSTLMPDFVWPAVVLLMAFALFSSLFKAFSVYYSD